MVNATTQLVQDADEQVYRTLCSYLTAAERQGVLTVADAITERLGGVEQLASRRVMVAYGGGKDSSYTVAFMRAVQLLLQRRHGTTFRLRVASMRHAGVPYAVMRNIHRVYERLELLGDERVELVMVDHDEISLFERDRPLPARVRDINRTDILMNGHVSRGDGRPTFCNSCNFSVASFYGLACWWRGGVDVVITGDSRKEQKQYYAWIMRLGQKYGVDVGLHAGKGFHGLLSVLSELAERYYRELYGSNQPAVAARHVHAGHSARIPDFVSIYDHVSYRVNDHWPLVVDFLGFEFDELAFSFTESDCANPALMAHLRGLRSQYVDKRSYAEGIEEYIALAQQLMRKKEIPPPLIDKIMARYQGEAGVKRMRERMTEYAELAHGLQTDHLICLVYSPFVNRGERLFRYAADLRPQWAPRLTAMHALLGGGTPAGSDWLRDELKSASGLELDNLRQLYRREAVDFGGDRSLIAVIRKNDPHKGYISSRDPATGRPRTELISGR